MYFLNFKSQILFVFLAYILCAGDALLAQNFNQQLEIQIDNDKFILQDRYYTSGLFLHYKKGLKNNFVFKKTETNILQLHIGLGNETYTPTDLSSFDTSRFDRPFAGWFFGSLGVTKFKEQSSLYIGVEAGITGEESFSGDLQLIFHEFLGLGNRPTWLQQIDSKTLFNAKLKYVRNFQLNTHNVIQLQIQPTIGTKDVFFENTIKYIFGKINVFQQSAINGVVNDNSSRELFGVISIGHKYVVHNTIIQGGISRNEVNFTASPTRNIFKLGVSGVLKLQRTAFTFGYNFNSKETALSSAHGYGTIQVARSF